MFKLSKEFSTVLRADLNLLWKRRFESELGCGDIATRPDQPVDWRKAYTLLVEMPSSVYLLRIPSLNSVLENMGVEKIDANDMLTDAIARGHSSVVSIASTCYPGVVRDNYTRYISNALATKNDRMLEILLSVDGVVDMESFHMHCTMTPRSTDLLLSSPNVKLTREDILSAMNVAVTHNLGSLKIMMKDDRVHPRDYHSQLLYEAAKHNCGTGTVNVILEDPRLGKMKASHDHYILIATRSKSKAFVEAMIRHPRCVIAQDNTMFAVKKEYGNNLVEKWRRKKA